MPIVNKTKRTAAIYNRGREVVKVYDHGKLSWQKSTSIPDYLCFTALEAGQFTLTIPAAVTPTYLSYIEWSKDGRTWNHHDNSSEAVTIDVQVAQGEKVYWRGSGKRMSYSGNNGYTSGFSTTGKFAISGHLASILKGSDFEDIDFSGAAFARLFQDCSNLTSAEELILPSFTVANVFSSMFLRCTALVSAPELPPVTNLTTGCYYQMFFGCSSLTHVKCLATDISATNCLYNWLYGVSSTGTFIQAAGVTWPRGASGIPTGWVDVEKRTMPSGYKQLLQVTSNGTAYIQLSFGFEETDEVAATFSVDTSQTTDKYIVCPQTWNSNNNRYGMGVNGGGYYTGAFGNRSTGNTILTPRTSNDGELHNWTYAAATFAVTDKSCSINITGYTFGGITTNLRLFYGYNSNTKGAISSYKHIKGSTTACDFVAAIRESNDTAGLYDLANDEFMTCNGLTAGEEI